MIDFEGRWIGNFSRGKTHHDTVLCQFAPHHVHVISGGNHYVVDVAAKSAVVAARDWIGASIFSHTANLLIVFDLSGAAAWQDGRRQWDIDQTGWWDGIRAVCEVGKEIHGEAYDPACDAWRSFRLEAETGHLLQGAWRS